MSFDDADLGICFNIFFAREVTDFPSPGEIMLLTAPKGHGAVPKSKRPSENAVHYTVQDLRCASRSP